MIVFLVTKLHVTVSLNLAKNNKSELTAHALAPIESGSMNHQMKEPNGGNTLVGHVEALV